ncbi:hypothetical protein [Aliiglaciecola sp. LCG003]|uniref:hypothetical protein n=1 Tax=Aliiglaciecola sp. LCG003 TaxID=3053655 RepID=UPI002573D1FF|nr:hypothetical protein [Aliiglaciecola sp. LCG003]WJG10226.1 hypothetical protein QR722_04105 [Aliiglaciecola sp. LCG003]
MKDSSSFQYHIEQACEPLLNELDDLITWQWDEHLSCLLAEFSVDHAQFVYLHVQKHFPHVWDKKSIKSADPLLKHRAGFFNALKKNQQLLTQDTTGQHDIMASWWPWGHGATVSVRLFQVSNLPYQAPSGLFRRLTGWART